MHQIKTSAINGIKLEEMLDWIIEHCDGRSYIRYPSIWSPVDSLKVQPERFGCPGDSFYYDLRFTRQDDAALTLMRWG